MQFKTRIKKQLCDASICSKSEIAEKKQSLVLFKKNSKITLFAKIIADHTRGKMVFLLFHHKALCVCDIANILDISVASASQHLRKMYNLTLVATKKEGTTIFYSISDKLFIAFLKKIYT